MQAAPGFPEVRKTLRENGRAVACVVLDSRPELGSRAAAPTLKQRSQEYRASQNRCLAALGREGYSLRYRYRYSPVLALEITDEAVLNKLSRMEAVMRLRADQQGAAALIESRQLIRANEAQALGVSGEGRIVAVLDSGVDRDHPDLEEGLLDAYGQHFLDQGDDVGEEFDDDNGHGTHVSGILGSRGRITTAGIAPGASILPVKVLDSRNVGWFTDWAAGIEYVVSLHQQDNGISVDVINMSLASHSLYTGNCENAHEAIAGAAAAARELGMVVLAASGNNGNLTSLALPSCMESVVAVGSIQDTIPGNISAFSNLSPLLDILAPGEAIISSGQGGGTATISGTSQATPHIAGAICLMLEANPALSPEQLVDTLLATGIDVLDNRSGLTFPRLDCLSAVEMVVVPAVTELSCVVDSSRTLVVTWNAPPNIDALEISVLHGNTQRASSSLEAGISEYQMNGLESGIHEISVTCLRRGIRSPVSTCALEPDDFALAFTRGNCNSDAAFDLTDAIFTLNLLFFAADEEPGCWAACDSNDDGEMDITDAIYALGTLFLGTAIPPEPYPGCGYDTTPPPIGGSLTCEQEGCLVQ